MAKAKNKNEIIEKTLALSVMDKEASEALDSLSETLTVKDMTVFQPIVQMTNDVAEILDIKYKKDDEDSIQAFKDGKKTYGAFNTALKDAKRDLKEPYTKTIKDIDTVFNKFGDLYTMAKDHLALEFKPHLDEQQRLKEEKERKKNEAREKEMAELKKQNEEILQKNENTNIYNGIKYDIIGDYKTKAVASLNTLNTTAIENGLKKLEGLQLSSAIYDADTKLLPADLDKLDKEQHNELLQEFNKVKSSITEIYRTRLNELVELERMRSQEAEREKQTENIAKASVHIPPAPPVEKKEDDQAWITDTFIKDTVDRIMDIRDNCDTYYEVSDKSDKDLAKNISIMLTRALEYINNKTE